MTIHNLPNKRHYVTNNRILFAFYYLFIQFVRSLITDAMILYKKKEDIQKKISFLKTEGKTIGFVPTMGALHNGHLSLIEASKKSNDITVCSIFVNPTQFNDSSDYKKYPVTLENDVLLLQESDTHILFLPSVNEIYPENELTSIHYELGDLETMLEGKYRPGHFQGVCQVVHRLFTIINPNTAYLGQKDYQQCLIIKKLIQLYQLPVTIVIHPTVRETTGLAMSSRNLRLREEDKNKATILYKALSFIKENIRSQNLQNIKQQAEEMIVNAGFDRIDYLTIADTETLHSLQSLMQKSEAVALVAAFVNDVRLIDNLIVT